MHTKNQGKEIILVRHGESEGNRLQIIQGRTDYPLSERGRRQAELTGEALSGFAASRIYCSPLRRAQETAQAIGKVQGAPVEVLEVLREIDLGILEGLTMAQVYEKHPQVFKDIKDGALLHSAEGAEPEESVKQRAREAVQYLMNCGHEKVIVVSHLGMLERVMARLIRKVMDQDHLKYFPQFLKNCCITHLSIDGPDSRVIKFNSIDHLQTLSI